MWRGNSREGGAAAAGEGRAAPRSRGRVSGPAAAGRQGAGRGVGRETEGSKEKPLGYQRSELGDALVGIVVHVVSVIPREAAFQTIGF